MRYFLLFLLTIILNASYGQSFSYPPVKANGQRIADFVPAGWTILDSAYGDLNKDGLQDAALVLQHKDSVLLVNSLEDTVLAQPRMLLLVFRNPADNGFALTEQSNSFILKHDNPVMDDPYQGITIDKGILKIDFHLFYTMGSWYTTSSAYKFRFDGTRFILIGADLTTVHRASLDYEAYSYNFLIRKGNYTKGNEQKGIKKKSVRVLSLPSPLTFKTFKEPFSFEIEKDIYL